MSSSLTDLVDGYAEFCARAATDDNTFASFRSHPLCRSVIDTLGRTDGLLTALALFRDAPAFAWSGLAVGRRNDAVGSPTTFRYWPPLGRLSPTTLRYLHIAGHIRKRFGALDGWRVAEIGGGYGGQARILTALNPRIAHYAVYDLPPVLELTRRWLNEFGAVDGYAFLDTFDLVPPPEPYDLIVSNYAFSELHRDGQEAYLERVVGGARHGFMLFNATAGRDGLPSLTVREVATRLPSAKVERGLSAIDRRNGVDLLWW